MSERESERESESQHNSDDDADDEDEDVSDGGGEERCLISIAEERVMLLLPLSLSIHLRSCVLAFLFHSACHLTPDSFSLRHISAYRAPVNESERVDTLQECALMLLLCTRCVRIRRPSLLCTC